MPSLPLANIPPPGLRVTWGVPNWFGLALTGVAGTNPITPTNIAKEAKTLGLTMYLKNTLLKKFPTLECNILLPLNYLPK